MSSHTQIAPGASVLARLAAAGEMPSASTLGAHLELHREVDAPRAATVARALLAGHRTDRLGYAFASGYVEALARLHPPGAGVPMALAHTEKGGGHPRAIETRAEVAGEEVVLTGGKSFVTLAEHARRVLVVAREGERPDGTPQLGVYEVSVDTPGLLLSLLPELPFAPELRHASMRLEGVRVRVGARLPGDGYADGVKLFRSIEDLHVLAAAVGYGLSLSRRAGLSAEDLGRGLALAATLLGMAEADPKSPALHLALDHAFMEATTLFATLREQPLPEDEGKRLMRDLPLLSVAGKARRARAEKARAALGLV